MVRSTRSTTAHLETADAQPAQLPLARNKKRKRHSDAMDEDTPTPKQPRLDHGQSHDAEMYALNLSDSAGCHLDQATASQILTVLERYDNQGLLDRVFPLSVDFSTSSTSHAAEQPISFRALLNDPSLHPLRVLRSAVQHLYPISTHRRSQPNTPAAQQLAFCELAMILLDETSVLLPHFELSPHEITNRIPKLASTGRKFALMQKLPTATWWSSLDAAMHARVVQGQPLSELNSVHAELVAILPSPVPSRNEVPTLGSFLTSKKGVPKFTPPGPRRVHSGSFLDYGPYASFAPTFDQNGAEVGRVGMGSILSDRRRPQGIRERILALQERMQTARDDGELHTLSGVGESSSEGPSWDTLEDENDPLQQLKHIADQEALESGAARLLETNRRALLRLLKMQRERLVTQDPSQIGSEERSTAEDIMDSLSLLLSMRPRTSVAEEQSQLVPPATELRKLHRILPTSATMGWNGTLPEAHAMALQDDMTVYVRPGTVLGSSAPPATSTAPTGPVAPVYAHPPKLGGSYGTPTAIHHPSQGGSYPYQYNPGSWYMSTTSHTNRSRHLQQNGVTTNAWVSPGPAAHRPMMAVGNTVSSVKPQPNGWAGHNVPTLPLH